MIFHFVKFTVCLLLAWYVLGLWVEWRLAIT